MFLIGLTGGIAAGKSTVAALWSSLGAIEIDADQLAREVVEPGTAGFSLIAQRFGSKVVETDGSLNRKALAQIVFADPISRKELEEIVHPLVRNRVQEILGQLPSDSIVVYTVPLLVEANVDLPFDAVVTVEAPEEVRIQRLIDSRGMSASDASARIAAQAKPIERAAAADYILNSNQGIDLLNQDARALWQEFKLRATK